MAVLEINIYAASDVYMVVSNIPGINFWDIQTGKIILGTLYSK
jgi:hypothetical protein